MKTEEERLRRRIAKRDRRIAGMARQIEDLEHSLALHAMKVEHLPIDVQRAVQRAFCNVRMVPILGIGGSDRILEVRQPDKETK